MRILAFSEIKHLQQQITFVANLKGMSPPKLD